jgi:hypothetical protein
MTHERRSCGMINSANLSEERGKLKIEPLDSIALYVEEPDGGVLISLSRSQG